MHSKNMRHFDRFNILTDKQHRFRKRRSTVTQLVATIQDITSKLRSGRDQVDVILLDFVKKLLMRNFIKDFCKLSFYGVLLTGFKHSLVTGSKKCYWMGADQIKQMLSPASLKKPVWAHFCSWFSSMIFQKWSKPPIPVFLRSTAFFISSSIVMQMLNLSSKISNL